MEEGTLLGALTELFRRYGFDGVSLARITDATGLVKASLYHRFPEGKDAMAEATLTHVDRVFGEDVLAPLREAAEPAARVAEVARRIRKFYDGGELPCLLETMTISPEYPDLRNHARATLGSWVKAFGDVARECGCGPAEATRRAEDAIAAIEGGLVIARAGGGKEAFQRAVDCLVSRLTEAPTG